VRDFLRTETAGAVALVAGAVAALVWANVGASSYESVWHTLLSLRLGGASLSLDLRHWVNEGLIALFFFVVGLEARRELDLGELRERRRVTLPVLGALGGMAIPIAIYEAFNAGGAHAGGWGAAMSTDTAFALGALALFGRAVPPRLRSFLLTLVVADDLTALIVIAVAYTNRVDPAALGAAAGLFATLLALRRLGAPRALVLLAGVGLWVAMQRSGVDPVVAGLAVGLVTPAHPAPRGALERATALVRSFREQPTPELARSAQLSVATAVSANERLQHALHPWTSFLMVPLFALANAGISIDGATLARAATSPVTLGILVGYALGKPVGIVGTSWLVTTLQRGRRRLPVGWGALIGGGATAGTGFTVSLLIASLAFSGRALQEAKLGVLGAVIAATLLGAAIFGILRLLPARMRVRQRLGTSAQIVDLAQEVDPQRDHIRGPAHAPVTLVEYADYECPYCGQAEPAVRELLSDFGSELRYAFRHLPLADVHPRSQLAAEASEAAGAQGRFWAMHDRLFAHPDALTPSELIDHARELELDVERFSDELRRHVYAPRIAEDVADADVSGVAGTPTFFVNGRRHHGAYDLDALSRAARAARAHTLVRS
jgi:Na+/H+ antiporter NhaA